MKMCRTGGHVLDRSSLEQYTTLLTVGSVVHHSTHTQTGTEEKGFTRGGGAGGSTINT